MTSPRPAAGMTTAEKMFARASGMASAKAGDIVVPVPDWVIIHDAYLEAAYRELRDLGYGRIAIPDKVIAVTDHEVVYTTPKAVERGRANRAIAKAWRIAHFYDAGQGGHGHIFPMEAGLVRPGMFLAAYDMHCSNFGAIGAYAMRAGPDVTVLLATGSLWMQVPQTVRVRIEGAFAPGVHARDLGFFLSSALAEGRLGINPDGVVVEFCGDRIDALSVATRIGMINTLTEIDVANVLFPPMEYDGSVPAGLEHLASDATASFLAEFSISLDDISPMVAEPGAPHNAADLASVAGKPIDHAFIGSCGSGHYEDFAAAAEILRGRTVAAGRRLFIVPGTVATAERLMQEGLGKVFLNAGAMILPSGCGPCAGGVMGPLGPGEVSISTAATNGVGRMGSREAECYLGSPLTVAASAVAGCIADPRPFLRSPVGVSL